jgi:hypothetical protein
MGGKLQLTLTFALRLVAFRHLVRPFLPNKLSIAEKCFRLALLCLGMLSPEFWFQRPEWLPWIDGSVNP